MTEVKAERTKTGFIIQVQGHTQTNVCNAISTLTAALEGWLMNYCKGKYTYKQGDGYCRFIVSKKAQTAVDVFIIGILRLEKNFPDMIKADIRI